MLSKFTTLIIPCIASVNIQTVPLNPTETDLVIPIHYGMTYGSLSTSAMVIRSPSPPMDVEVELKFENDRDQSPSDEEITDYVDFVLIGSIQNSATEFRSFNIQLPRHAFVATRRFLRSTVLDISGGSIFAQTAGSFLLSPPRENESAGSIVIRPRNFDSYCYNGEMSISQYVGNTELYARVFWLYNGTIDNPSQTDIDERVSAYNFDPARVVDSIPNEAWDTFVFVGLPRALGGANFEITGENNSNSRTVRFDCSSEDVIEELPTLVYEILRSQDELDPVNFIHLFPRDYLSIIDGQCSPRFHPSGGTHGMFGMPTLSKTVIFVDSVRRQIGFAEPL